ncbi:MAG: hypothetical protein H8E62_03685 [Planctomycetes bacterium]|nr:hypothetical protein [Planctomycetota bacterium]
MSEPIRGGYILKARCIENSDIAHAPPHAREMFDYFLRKAFWKDGDQLKRGQVLTCCPEIREALHWKVGFRKEKYSESKIEAGMKTLRKAGMITTRKTTHKVIVTVCNYERFQTPDNYDNRTDNRTDNRNDNRPIDEEENKKEEQKNLSVCPEPDKPGSVPEVVLRFAVKGGGHWELERSKLEEYAATFAALGAAGVLEELKQARQWLLDNPKKIKTARGMPNFLGGWLRRSVGKKDGGWEFPQKNGAHDLANQEAIRERLLERPAGEESPAERLKRKAEERLKKKRRQAAEESED